MRKCFVILICFSLLAFMTSCGGSGSGGSGGSSSSSGGTDTTPDTFIFTDQTDVALSTVIESNAITVSGIDAAADISVTDGEYSINSGTFTSYAGTIDSGDSVVVRQTSSANYSTTTDATLTIGGVSDIFSVTTVTGHEATVHFPPAQSLTDEDNITVRGVTTHSGVIGAVRANGVLATTSDGFQTWSVNVPLSIGANTITIETEDGDGSIESNAASVSVIRGDNLFVQPFDVEWDEANSRLLVLDPGRDALMAVDPTTGVRTIISDASTGSGTAFDTPLRLELDPANNRGFVVDIMTGIFSVNLTTGDRVLISGATGGSGTDFNPPVIFGVAYDTTTQRLFASGFDQLMEIDPTTGERILISDDATNGNGGDLDFDLPFGLCADLANNRILVADFREYGPDTVPTTGSLLSVSLVDGSRSVLSDGATGTGIEMQATHDIVRGIGNTVVIADHQSQAIYSIDLATGDRAIIASSDVGSGVALGSPEGLGFNGSDTLYSVSNSKLISVRLNDGYKETISGESVGSGAQLGSLFDVEYDQVGNRLIYVDDVSDSVGAIDLVTGNRTVLSDDDIGIGPVLRVPRAIAYDSVNDRVFVSDSTLASSLPDSVYEIDLSTGNRVSVSSGCTNSPEAIVWDPVQERLLKAGQPSSVLEQVDLTTGACNPVPLVSDTVGYDDIILSSDANIAYSVGNRTDTFVMGAFSTNLSTGLFSTIGEQNDGLDPPIYSSYSGIALDESNNRLFLTQTGGSTGNDMGSVMEIDLSDNSRTELISATQGTGPLYRGFGSVFLTDNETMLLVEEWAHSVFTVDMVTNERVISSR